MPPLPLPAIAPWTIDPDMRGRSFTRRLVRLVGDLAERQYGVVGRQQLLRLGVPQSAIDALVQLRHLRALHAGVYAVGHRALSAEGRRLAALLACGEHGVLSHRTAAATWGLVDDDGGALHLSVPLGVRRTHRGLVVHRCRRLEPQDVTTYRRLALTRKPRTVVDLAAVAPERTAWGAADRALRRGCTPAALRLALERSRGRPGSASIRRYLAVRRTTALRLRSELERRAAEILLGSDLPPPRFNPRLAAGGETLEVDVLWSQRRVVLELDGREYHEGVVAELEDARREALLREAGFLVVRAAWWDVVREPGRLLGRLRSHLA